MKALLVIVVAIVTFVSGWAYLTDSAEDPPVPEAVTTPKAKEVNPHDRPGDNDALDAAQKVARQMSPQERERVCQDIKDIGYQEALRIFKDAGKKPGDIPLGPATFNRLLHEMGC